MKEDRTKDNNNGERVKKKIYPYSDGENTHQKGNIGEKMESGMWTETERTKDERR